MPVNSEERLKILKMVQDGRITADEATQLLEALERARPTPPQPPPPPETGMVTGRSGRWLRVRVTDTDSGKTRVNIRLPLSDRGIRFEDGHALCSRNPGYGPQ